MNEIIIGFFILYFLIILCYTIHTWVNKHINSLKELNHILTSENFILQKELEKHEMGKPKS
jgi:hypothetical protein